MKEPVILSRIPATSSSISLVNCYTEKLYGTKNGKPLKGSLSPKKDDPKFNYTSLENAVETIYAFLTGPAGEVFPRVADYVSIIKYYDSTTWQPLSNKLVW